MKDILYLIMINNRTVIAKCSENKFIDAVEIIHSVTSQGVRLMGVLIGTVDELSENLCTFILDDDSMYVKAYFDLLTLQKTEKQ